MTAPMTRERLALLRDGYKPALDSYDSEDFAEVCVADLRELVSACEALLNERDGIKDAALEEAARAVENDCGIGIQHGDKIRALKGKR